MPHNFEIYILLRILSAASAASAGKLSLIRPNQTASIYAAAAAVRIIHCTAPASYVLACFCLATRLHAAAAAAAAPSTFPEREWY
jgi:hypothetical protein